MYPSRVSGSQTSVFFPPLDCRFPRNRESMVHSRVSLEAPVTGCFSIRPSNHPEMNGIWFKGFNITTLIFGFHRGGERAVQGRDCGIKTNVYQPLCNDVQMCALDLCEGVPRRHHSGSLQSHVATTRRRPPHSILAPVETIGEPCLLHTLGSCSHPPVRGSEAEAEDRGLP